MSGRFNLAEYVTVDDRITRYWEMHPKPEGSIQTEIIWVSNDGLSVAIKATVYQGDRILATGIAQEERLSGLDQYGKPLKGANSTSWWENCETSAIGRALANMDMSLSKNRPSRQEMEKVERYAGNYGVVAYEPANQPAPRRTPPPPSDPRPAVAPVAAAGPPYTEAEYNKVIDDAWWAAEDGRLMDDIRNDLNLLRHRMTKEQRKDTLYALEKIEAQHFAPAGVAG